MIMRQGVLKEGIMKHLLRNSIFVVCVVIWTVFVGSCSTLYRLGNDNRSQEDIALINKIKGGHGGKRLVLQGVRPEVDGITSSYDFIGGYIRAPYGSKACGGGKWVCFGKESVLRFPESSERTIGNITFIGNERDPLVFVLMDDGLVYLHGRGTVALPDGTKKTFP